MSVRLKTIFAAVSYAAMLTTLAVGASCRVTAAIEARPIPEVLDLEGDLRVHDPAAIRQADLVARASSP